MHSVTCSVDMLIIFCSAVIQLNFITLPFASCILCNVHVEYSEKFSLGYMFQHTCNRQMNKITSVWDCSPTQWALNETFKCVCLSERESLHQGSLSSGCLPLVTAAFFKPGHKTTFHNCGHSSDWPNILLPAKLTCVTHQNHTHIRWGIVLKSRDSDYDCVGIKKEGEMRKGGVERYELWAAVLKRYKVGQWRRSAIICRGRCWTILHRITAAHSRTSRESERETVLNAFYQP